MSKLPRASRLEIFDYLTTLLEDKALTVTLQVSEYFLQNETENAMSLLKQFDSTIGGIGIHCRKPDEKLPGVYRALTYVEMPLNRPDPADATRGMIVAAGGYLEDLIKRGLGQYFIMEMIITFNKKPLGALVDYIKTELPTHLYKELKWFSGQVYNYAKHDFDAENRSDPVGDHYYGLDEAIAVYFIARKLGEELIQISGVSQEKLLAIS